MLTWPASPQKQGKRVTSSHYGILLIRPVIVSLRLLARIEVILPDGFFGFMADALAPAKASEGLVGELRSGSQQLFVDAHQVALAALGRASGASAGGLFPADSAKSLRAAAGPPAARWH